MRAKNIENRIRLLVICVVLFASHFSHAQDVYQFNLKWGSLGTAEGQFDNVYGVAVDSEGNIYATDYDNDRVQKFAPDGTFIAQWGSYGAGDSQFDTPAGIAVDAAGNVYVADVNNHRVQKFTADGIFITQWGALGIGDGKFDYPCGVAVDHSGNVYVTDPGLDLRFRFVSFQIRASPCPTGIWPTE